MSIANVEAQVKATIHSVGCTRNGIVSQYRVLVALASQDCDMRGSAYPHGTAEEQQVLRRSNFCR